MRMRWTTPARIQFRRDIRYIALDSPTAAQQVATRVRDAPKRLARDPLSGREGRVLDTRELVVPCTPFTIAYRVAGNVVEIVGVIHQAREWPESFAE